MKRFILPLIVVLALFLRLYSVSSLPVGFTPDEASFGYDAYSILRTGADQWGNKFPLVLKSFGDYKSPLYTYLTIPSVAAWGLTKFATKLPNAIIGTLAVLATFLLTYEILGRLKLKDSLRERFADLSALLMAVSPWAVMTSRGAFEANLITFFLPIGIYFFLKGIEKPVNFIWSALFFGLNLLTYHSAKVITPAVVLGLLVIFWNELKSKKIVNLIPGVAVFTFFSILFAYSFIIGGAGRITERSITQGALEAGAQTKIELIQKGANPFIARIFHNKYQVVIQRFLSNYFQYFSFRFLFTQGPAETTYGMIPGVGVIYIFEGILLLGIIFLLRGSQTRKIILILLGWLLIAPVPAALSTGVGYSANRAEGMIPVIQIIEAFGALGWSIFLSKLDKRMLSVAVFAFALLAGFELQKTEKIYFRDSPKIAGEGMLSGNLEAAEWLGQNIMGRNVVVSRRLSEPQIYVAFAGKVNPGSYQEATKSWKVESWVDQIPEYRLGNYVFANIDWKVDSQRVNTILVGRPDEFPAGIIALKTFLYPDGKPSIYIIDTNQKLYAGAY